MNEKFINKENVLCIFERNLNVGMNVQMIAMYFAKYNKVFYLLVSFIIC